MDHIPPGINLEPEIFAFVQRSYDISDTSADLTLDEQRANYDYYCSHFTPPHPPQVASRDQFIDAPQGSVPVRWYRNERSDSAVCVIFFHGGGFVVGGLNSHDFLCARLCRDAGCTVVAVDYRLAPEHVFPAAFDDCYSVLLAVQLSADRHALDPNRIILCGDSAGGNLAAAVSLAHRDHGSSGIRGQIMVYPTLAADTSLPAYAQFAHAPMLSTQDMEFYLRAYLGKDGKPCAYSAPLLAEDLSGLPPALLLPMEYDPLRDDALAYHRKLLDAGGQSALYMGKGLVHGCLRAIDISPGVQEVYRRMVDFIAAAAK